MNWLAVIASSGILTLVLWAYMRGEKAGENKVDLSNLKNEVEEYQQENVERQVIHEDYDKLKSRTSNSWSSDHRMRDTPDGQAQP